MSQYSIEEKKFAEEISILSGTSDYPLFIADLMDALKTNKKIYIIDYIAGDAYTDIIIDAVYNNDNLLTLVFKARGNVVLQFDPGVIKQSEERMYDMNSISQQINMSFLSS